MSDDDSILIGFLVDGEDKVFNHIQAKIQNLLKNKKEEE